MWQYREHPRLLTHDMTPIDPFDLKEVLKREEQHHLEPLEYAPRVRTDVTPKLMEIERGSCHPVVAPQPPKRRRQGLDSNSDTSGSSDMQDFIESNNPLFMTWQATLGRTMTLDGRPAHADNPSMYPQRDPPHYHYVHHPELTPVAQSLTESEKANLPIFLGGHLGRQTENVRVGPGIKSFMTVDEEEQEKQKQMKQELKLYWEKEIQRLEEERKTKSQAEKQGFSLPVPFPFHTKKHHYPPNPNYPTPNYPQERNEDLHRKDEYAKMIDQQVSDKRRKNEQEREQMKQLDVKYSHDDYWARSHADKPTKRTHPQPNHEHFDPVTGRPVPAPNTNPRRIHQEYYSDTSSRTTEHPFFSQFGNNGLGEITADMYFPRTMTDVSAMYRETANKAELIANFAPQPNDAIMSKFGAPGNGAPIYKPDGSIDARPARVHTRNMDIIHPVPPSYHYIFE